MSTYREISIDQADLIHELGVEFYYSSEEFPALKSVWQYFWCNPSVARDDLKLTETFYVLEE